GKDYPWLALPHWLDRRDRALLQVDREADPVSRLYSVEQRRRLDAIAHGHRFHEALDRFVIEDDLACGRHRRDNRSFTNDGLRPCRLRLACSVGRTGHWLEAWDVCRRIQQASRRGQRRRRRWVR